ncbi:MAG: sugar ABC transporter ATP-binding protein [Propionibacteriaceae bacterium]|jgi:putative multiple sugar transport system ATP-binding protein|nr:sugar ABC transporter ATP-binding protein [Propionibacteriaceae bacterium]
MVPPAVLGEAQDTAIAPKYVLEMRHITKEFPGVRALDDVTMAVRDSDIHAICGENGAGKSTLMKVLSGVHPFGTYTGEILYNGELVTFKNIRESEAAGIVIIHQELALIPELSIAENIFLCNEVVGRFGIIDWAKAYAQTSDLLHQVGLNIDPRTPIKNLGVGQQQLVEIAKALSKNVQLLILDEPTSALNEEDAETLFNLMRDLKRKGVTCIMISHKLNEIAQVADAITILRDGKTVETYPVVPGEVDVDRIIRAMVGRSLENRFPSHDSHPGDVVFEVRDWRVEDPNVPGRLLCKDISLYVRAGEIVGLAGLMGAGRTEFARSVFGRNYGIYLGGEILLHGSPLTLKSVEQAIDHRISYVSEDRKMLGLNLLDDVKATTISAWLKGVCNPLGLLDPHKVRSAAEEYREKLGIKTASVDVGVSTLSGGNQQKVVLAKWLFPDPDVLILDEPTRGIDVGAKYEIYRIMQQLADQGKAVIMISSELPELLGVADRIYTICEGAVTGEMPAAEATQEALMRMMTTITTTAPAVAR